MNNVQGDIDAFAPERGMPVSRWVVAAYGSPGAESVSIRRQQLVVHADARDPGVRFLIRGPKDGTLNLTTGQGSIMVADFDGVANAHTDRGDVRMLLPQYGNASVGTGSISANIASLDWNGTLHFAVQRGNVELYVNENAKAHVRMHTDDGNIFSDFPLKGFSHGNNETIEMPINGGASRGIDIEVHQGSIRLMQLKPQI